MIDLSRLPAPSLVEPLSFEAIKAELVADFAARWAERRAVDPTLPEIDVLSLETDPLVVLMETAAFRDLLLRARVNDAGRATMLAYAGGADLDHIAATFGVARLTVAPATASAPAVMEDDGRLRRRVQLAPESWTTAGAAGAYVFHALTAAPDLVDASAVKVAPGEVAVTLLGPPGAAVPDGTTIARVQAALAADHVRPLTDVVIVQAPAVVATPVALSLTLYPGPDGEAVRAEAEARVRAFLRENRLLGRDLRLSAIYARAHVDGVQRVEVVEPATDVVVDPTMVVEADAVSVTVAGRDE